MTPQPTPTPEQWAEAIQILAGHAHNPILDRLGVQVCNEYLTRMSAPERTQLNTRIYEAMATVFGGPQPND